MSGTLGRTRYDFAWEILRVFIEGDSPIDLPALAFDERREARKFLADYGYDLDQEDERDEAHRVHLEAVAFIKRYFSDGLTLPAEVERPQDLVDLLMWASSPERDSLQMWSCAVLRVMHTVSHLNHTIRSEFYHEIKRQILDRFSHHIFKDGETGRLSLGRGPEAVPLEGVYFKEDKSRDSLILKLLHKPNNVAQDVYDRLGIKLVVPEQLDALMVLRYMRKHNLVIFANVTPGRSRNNMLDLDQFHHRFEEENPPELDFEDYAVQHHHERVQAPDLVLENPYSSPEYRSIRFTCRHLVKVQSPTFKMAQKMRAYLQRFHVGPELEAMLEELEERSPREQHFLFPFEVQLMDLHNHGQSLNGASSHDEYKARQLKAARLRVMGNLLKPS